MRDHGACSAEARGAGLPCHHLIEASMAFRERECGKVPGYCLPIGEERSRG